MIVITDRHPVTDGVNSVTLTLDYEEAKHLLEVASELRDFIGAPGEQHNIPNISDEALAFCNVMERRLDELFKWDAKKEKETKKENASLDLLNILSGRINNVIDRLAELERRSK